jgi:hypothetical protein
LQLHAIGMKGGGCAARIVQHSGCIEWSFHT